MFPKNGKTGQQSSEKASANLSIELLGNRINYDQTVVEYLIEFLLVFASAKHENDPNSKMHFHTQQDLESGELIYRVEPRVALRRFIFYNNSKQDSLSGIDTMANDRLWEILRNDTRNGEEDVDLIHDLLHSYAIITRNRGWYAQALLPAAPEFLLTDLQGIKKRQKGSYSLESKEVDREFDFDKHNFLARGGQILYLHLLEAILDSDAAEKGDRQRIEQLLTNMLTCSGKQISLLSDFVQKEWESDREYQMEIRTFHMGHITDAYKVRSSRFLNELMFFLSCDIHPVARIELLAQGMILSLLRVMHIVAEDRIHPGAPEPLWIMDMSGLGGASNIGKLAATSYSNAYNAFLSAMSIICSAYEPPYTSDEQIEMIQKGKQNTADVFKALGKNIRLIIPPRGGYERFSLSEQLVRYLVLSLVPPASKVTYDSFLDDLYDHFRMVIGPAQYRRSIAEGTWNAGGNMENYFDENGKQFQNFLKQCGFLRDLSDATAIVENPYKEVMNDETVD